MSSAGQRYVDSVDAIANAVATDYDEGGLVVDLTDGKLYVAFGGAFVLIGSQIV